MLTIAQFTDHYGPRASGLVHAVQQLEGEVLAAGHRVVLVAPASPSDGPHAAHPLWRQLRLPSLPVPGVKLRMSPGGRFDAALEQFAADPPDVVHVHGLGPIGLLGMWVAAQSARPVVVTWHTDFDAYADYFGPLLPVLDVGYRLLLNRFDQGRRQLVQSLPEDGRGRARARLTRLAATMLDQADVVTTPSAKTARRVLDLAPDATVQVVPNGCDPLPVRAPLPPGRGRRLLYVGWISAEKGIPVLLEAFERVNSHEPAAELMLVGSSNTADLGLRRALRRGVRAGWLALPGEVARAELAGYYAAADAFVLPSTTDTQALVLHEAAHAGLPLVLVDPALDLVAERGVNAVVTRPEPEDLARGIDAMLDNLDDPEYVARAAARGRDLAARFTVQHQGEEFVGIYRRLATQVG